MYWKESLTIKGPAIYQLANCPRIFLHYLIELFHTSNMILRVFVTVIIQIDRNLYGWNVTHVAIKYFNNDNYLFVTLICRKIYPLRDKQLDNETVSLLFQSWFLAVT